MTLPDTSHPDSSGPAQEGWIALSPAHLLPWILLLLGFLHDLIFLIPSLGVRIAAFTGWGVALARWSLGGMAAATAFREYSATPFGPARKTALILATVMLGLRICLAFAFRFVPGIRIDTPAQWVGIESTFVMAGLCALVLLLQRHEDRGGSSDAAMVSMIFATGVEWIWVPGLAIAAMGRHPLLAALWEALRAPGRALEGGWYDALDEDRRLRNLGACALALSGAWMALAGSLVLDLLWNRAGSWGFGLWWTAASLAATYIASLLLALHVVMSGRGRRGRWAAITAILIDALPALLVLAAAIFIALILTDTIHFRLF